MNKMIVLIVNIGGTWLLFEEGKHKYKHKYK